MVARKILNKESAVDIRSVIEWLLIETVKPNQRRIRAQSGAYIRAVAASFEEFGLLGVIVIGPDNVIVTGHAIYAAAQSLGRRTVPVIRASHLSRERLRAFAIAHNRLAERGTWNMNDDGLPAELKELAAMKLDFDLEVIGYDHAEIDTIIFDSTRKRGEEQQKLKVLANNQPPVSRPGDLFLLGPNKVMCATALKKESYEALLSGAVVDAVFSDPPYGVPIEGHASGNGKTIHRPFIEGCNLSDAELQRFLAGYLTHAGRYCKPGGIVFGFIDWRHSAVMAAAGRDAGLVLLNIVVWVKDNPGMGSFYRSGHEFIHVLRNGSKSHRNNIQLGRFGRARSNVWRYPSANDFGRGGGEGDLLARHPTPKPVPLVAGALLDCTARGETVLDPFLGSGTTVIAAERTGRIAFGMEIDPIYVDVAVRRWQDYTGKHAIHQQTGLSFDELRAQRLRDSDAA